MGGKTHTTHHAERVITEGDIRIQWSTYGTLLQVIKAVKRIYQLAIATRIQADGQSIDGEVPPILVILQRAVFHHRLARIVRIRLLAGSDKFHFPVVVFHLCRPEVLEYGHMCSTAQPFAQGLRHGNAATYHHHINVLGRTLQEDVAYIATYHIAFQPQFIGRSRYLFENVVFKILFQFVCRKFQHVISHFLY